MLRLLCFLPCALCLQPFVLSAQGTSSNSCVEILQLTAGQTPWRSDEKACATRLAPASTFKIPHALIGLETGVITTATVYEWDGTPHPDQPEWQHAHTVLSALRPSVVWFFQRMAPKIGASRMHDWLTRLNYGNADTSGDVTRYWLNGRLRVSPDEQLAFLKEFFSGSLPFRPEFQEQVRHALEQRPGTIQNALGIHPIDGRWDSSTLLTAKTGATTTPDGQRVSWLVGHLGAGARQYVFASAVWKKGEVDGLDGARLAVRTFIQRRLIAR
jgi:beta-lactamase class D